MNPDLRQLIHDALKSGDSLTKPWSSLVLAACDGRDALDGILQNAKTTAKADEKATATTHAGAYLTSLTVEGFRGIGPRQTLTLTPGPGLTIVVGRNGSGKSSFAEALEVLLTGDGKRWMDRSKIWKEGWRNLHQVKTAAIEARLDLEGGGQATVGCSWDAEAGLEAQKSVAQVKGKTKTTLQALGWTAALESYRPFLSYNELGSMLDEGPSKLYDALSLVLGLEDLVNAQNALAEARLARQKPFDAADEVRGHLVEQLKTLIAEEPDDRASQCLDALTTKNWGLDAAEKIVSAGAAPPATQDTAVLTRALALDAGDPALVETAVAALRTADQKLKGVVGTDADAARQTASLLEAEKWLKDASADIRNQRFAPIADKAMKTWEHLRQQSNVTLGKIELVGAKSSRRVSLDVTVNGVAGAALGVMSQGELHSLALSLFLPRATLPESPFRFVVIDDPVQSMDPSRVDGLARALEETALTRQVIVFTHDERLPEALRRLGIESRMLMVTRRPGSVVEVSHPDDDIVVSMAHSRSVDAAGRRGSILISVALEVLTMPKPVEVKALANYRIWLRYDDGIQGEVDLGDLAGRGVFKAWDDPAFFSAVRVGSHGAVEWGSGLDLCPDALYIRLTGRSPEELFPVLKSVDA